MLEYISKGVGFSGGSAADKVIGKAAAILFVYARISAVYGHVISRGAADVFDKYGITYSYGTITDHIVNRSGTGICPMEEAVKNTDNLNAAYNAICHRYEQLRKEGI